MASKFVLLLGVVLASLLLVTQDVAAVTDRFTEDSESDGKKVKPNDEASIKDEKLGHGHGYYTGGGYGGDGYGGGYGGSGYGGGYSGYVPRHSGYGGGHGHYPVHGGGYDTRYGSGHGYGGGGGGYGGGYGGYGGGSYLGGGYYGGGGGYNGGWH